MLEAIENLTQGLANKLTDTELIEYSQFYGFAIENLMWRSALPDTELFNIAKKDYDSSTQDVLDQRYGQARWSAQQAVEKTIKGLLRFAGTEFPTGGPKGYDLEFLVSLLNEHHGIVLSADIIKLAMCTPKIRYGEEKSTDEQSILANHAVLATFDQLRKDPNTAEILNLVPNNGENYN